MLYKMSRIYGVRFDVCKPPFKMSNSIPLLRKSGMLVVNDDVDDFLVNRQMLISIQPIFGDCISY